MEASDTATWASLYPSGFYRCAYQTAEEIEIFTYVATVSLRRSATVAPHLTPTVIAVSCADLRCHVIQSGGISLIRVNYDFLRLCDHMSDLMEVATVHGAFDPARLELLARRLLFHVAVRAGRNDLLLRLPTLAPFPGLSRPPQVNYAVLGMAFVLGHELRHLAQIGAPCDVLNAHYHDSDAEAVYLRASAYALNIPRRHFGEFGGDEGLSLTHFIAAGRAFAPEIDADIAGLFMANHFAEALGTHSNATITTIISLLLAQIVVELADWLVTKDADRKQKLDAITALRLRETALVGAWLSHFRGVKASDRLVYFRLMEQALEARNRVLAVVLDAFADVIASASLAQPAPLRVREIIEAWTYRGNSTSFLMHPHNLPPLTDSL